MDDPAAFHDFTAVLTYEGLPPPPDHALYNVLAVDGTPLAWTRGHGEAMAWFA